MNKPEREGFIEGGHWSALQIDTEPLRDEPPKKVIPAPEASPAPPPAPEPERDTWPLVIKLIHKPLQRTLTETVTEITFREPTAGDIMRCGGNPCRIEITELGLGTVVYNPIIDDAKMLRLMANLSGILEPFLQKMDPRDYNSCAHRLRRFFLPEQGIW